MLFPLFSLYYKLGNYDKAKEYLKRINKSNPNFIKLFKGSEKLEKGRYDGYYSKGDPTEVIMYFQTYNFLFSTMLIIKDFILEYYKTK